MASPLTDPGQPARSRFRAGGEAAAAALLMGAFLLLGLHQLERPGFHSDELLFATPALGAGGATYDPWLGLPLMVGGYLGALKAYLFMPLFAVWPPGVASVRVPSLLLSALALLGFALFVRGLAGRGPALLCLALLAFDPSYLFTARVDYGPTVLMQVLKAAALLLLLRLVEGGSTRALWGLVPALLLGVYDKLNFVWIVNALALGALAAHHGALRALARRAGWRFWLPLGVTAAALGLLVLAYIAPMMGEVHPHQPAGGLRARLGFTLDLVASTFDGSYFHRWVTYGAMGGWPVAGALHGLLLSLLALASLARRGTPAAAGEARLRRWLAFTIACEAALLVQLLATRMVWGPHHVLVLWPFPQAAAALALALLLARAGRRHWAARAGLAATAAALLVVWAGQARAARAYQRDIYARPSTANPLFTPEIYELSRYLNPRLPGVASVITADWGLRYPLRVLAPPAERTKVRDFWAVFHDLGPGQGRPLYKEWFHDRHVIVVSYLADRAVFPRSDRSWRAFLDKHLRPRMAVEVRSLGSYEVVCLSPEPAATPCGPP